MRKIILSMFGIATLSTPTLTIVACNNDTPLEITDNDIYGDTADDTSKINNICIHFANKIDNKIYSSEDFWHWKWDLNNRLKIIGLTTNVKNEKNNFWKFTLQKTKNKGVYVYEYIKSEKPIKNAQI